MIAVNEGKYEHALRVLDIRLDEEGQPRFYLDGAEKTQTLSKGYRFVNLNIVQGKTTLFLVHRLVALKFVPNDDPVNRRYIDHIDGNPENNRPENLHWVTHRENLLNPIHRNRLSVSQKKRFLDPEVRERQSRIAREIMNRPGMRELHSEKMKSFFQDPANREKASAVMRAKYSSPEMKEKLVRAHADEMRSIEQIDLKTGETIREFPGLREAQRATGIFHGNISAVCRGLPKHKSAGGYGWQFKTPPRVTNSEQSIASTTK